MQNPMEVGKKWSSFFQRRMATRKITGSLHPPSVQIFSWSFFQPLLTLGPTGKSHALLYVDIYLNVGG